MKQYLLIAQCADTINIQLFDNPISVIENIGNSKIQMNLKQNGQYLNLEIGEGIIVKNPNLCFLTLEEVQNAN